MILIKREDAKAFHPLGDEIEITPLHWNGPHVGKRLCEAMQVLRMLPFPMAGGVGAAWPKYIYEFDDLVEQQKQGELERTQKIQNRTRVSPSLREITRMETAIGWPARYLFERDELLLAVNRVALAHSLERPAEWVARKFGGYADTWRRRHDQGCDLIAEGLAVDRVGVF